MRGLPTSQLATCGDTSYEYALARKGSPSVVLINGSGGPIEGWYRVFAQLAEQTTTFAYNRPGIGRSSALKRPQTVTVMATELPDLLVTLDVPRPWVRVGHSFSGLVANLFARLNPTAISGVAFVEATAPEDVVLIEQHESVVQRALGWLLSRIHPLDANHESAQAQLSVRELAGAPPFPTVPVRVITGTKRPIFFGSNAQLRALRTEHQRRLLLLSQRAEHLEASRSGHFPQFSEPELVVSSIISLLPAPLS